MSKKQDKVATIIWRNENYGSISGTLAFRFDADPYPASDTAYSKFARTFRKLGFQANQARCAWIAQRTDDLPHRLEAALKEMGYSVEHAGAVPEQLEAEERPGPNL